MSASKPEPVSGGTRLLLFVLLAGATLLFVRGLTEDLPSRWGWRIDETPPADVVSERGLAAWPVRYPPLHRDLLLTTFATARALAPARFEVPDAVRWQLWLLGRSTTVAMALVTLVLIWQVARRFAPPGPALLAPLAWALAPTVAFHARTMNLDIPYVFWFACSLWAWLQLLERRTLGWALAFAGFGGAAILTKDQAFALYLLPAAWWFGCLVREARAKSGPLRAALQALVDRRFFLPALLVITFGALEYRLWHGSSFLLKHLHQLLGKASDPYRLVPEGAVGQIELLALTARNFQLATGAVTLLAALAGVVLAGSDPSRRRATTLLLFPISYYLGFLLPVGYVYDRFLIPVLLVLALFAPLAVVRLSTPRVRALAATLVATCLLAFDGRAALEISQRAVDESRNELTRLLSAPAFERGNPVGIGRDSKVLPRDIEVWDNLPPENACARLAARNWLVFEHNWSPSRLDPVERGLRRGTLGYRPVATFGGDAFETLDFTGALGSHLQRLDLEVVLYRKQGACPSPATDRHRRRVRGSAVEQREGQPG